MRKAGGSEVPQLFSKTFVFQPNGGSMSNIALVGNQDHNQPESPFVSTNRKTRWGLISPSCFIFAYH